jgi:predicted RNase H-like nuclease (RuvC/YqgF family)
MKRIKLSEEEREYIINIYHCEAEDLCYYEVEEAIEEYREQKEELDKKAQDLIIDELLLDCDKKDKMIEYLKSLIDELHTSNVHLKNQVFDLENENKDLKRSNEKLEKASTTKEKSEALKTFEIVTQLRLN